jgi:hypothetical protein
MNRARSRRVPFLACIAAALALQAAAVEAGWPKARTRAGRGYAVVPTSRPVGVAPSPMLGSFYPTPMLTVRGNGPAGGGYSALGQFGADASLSLYGPLSPLRATTAPVLVYTRGYDGLVRPTTGVSFSTPNLPEVTPVVYPTRANFYGGFRESGTPPWWPSGINYIDQN